MRDIVVAKLSDRYSAEFVVARLRDAGIVARITGVVEPAWTTGSPTRVMPVEVRVTEADAARAREVLEQAERDAKEEPADK